MNNNAQIDYLEIVDLFKKLKKENKNIFIQIKSEMLEINNKTCK